MKPLFATMAIALLCFSFIKPKTFIPPGTVQISDSLFADATEITNGNWQEYELNIKQVYGANSKEHLASLPDTLCWKEKLSYNEPYVKYYYRHPAYKNFPVVGVSYEQALAYCAWRTEKVKMVLSKKKNLKDQNFEYRLPTKAEWENLAETSKSILKNNGKNEKGIYQINCAHPYDSSIVGGMSAPYPDVTVPVNSYSKNKLGLYNLLGNVSEMVAEKGICKGGAWRNNLEECIVEKDYKYTKANAKLGFRCVCVIKNS